MNDLRPWAPVAGAILLLLLCLVVGSRTGRAAVDLPPLPRAVHVRRPDVADLGAEIATPLFSPSRSPAVEGTTPAAPPVPPPLVTGIVLGGGRAVALVKSANGGDTQMLHAGGAIDGWTIVGIASRQIVVSRAGAQQTIALEFGSASKPSAETGHAAAATLGTSLDGLAMANSRGLPQASIPHGSPLQPPQ
jgi:hypothetical protein